MQVGSSERESPAKPKKKETLTRVVMGRGREKVSVILGPRKKAGKSWKPETTGTTRQGQDYELLGNRSVDKWDDSAADTGTSGVSAARSRIVDKMEKEGRSRKRKTYLDNWDSSLDRGRVSYYVLLF
jgi:hypothetical protein